MISILEEVATECGKLTLSLRNQAMDAKDKEEQLGAHYSTRADRKSQELGLEILEKKLRGEFVIAEEIEGKQVVPEDCTVFDPLDGTVNYFNGIDDYAITLCTLRNGRPSYGVSYFPVRNVLISAVQGQGCFLGGFKTGKRIERISWHGKIDKTLFGADVGPWTMNQNTFDNVLRPLATKHNVISSLSAVEGASKVLFGQIGGYYNLGIAKIWDAAAMSLAIEEAGGIVRDPRGNKMKWNSIGCDWTVAANQELSDILLNYTCVWNGRK